MFTFDQIANITKGEVTTNYSHRQIDHFITDSRKLINRPSSVFIAIKGERHDGHNFIKELYLKGIRQFIVENSSSITSEIRENSNILLVRNSVNALQAIAAFHRNQFDYPVIGITGSNGKTIIKEWLGQLIENKYNFIKSPKSYNSQLGVPLSVLQMTEKHNMAIFEAGISTTGEMENLQKIIKPDYGIFTNIGSAHDEGFTGNENKILEKWKLFSESDTVIYCRDHELIHRLKPKKINSFTWGKNQDANVNIHFLEKHDNYTNIRIDFRNKSVSLKVPFVDDASLENIMHCISMMIFLKTPWLQISETLGKLTNIEMRLQLKKGINNCYLIDDSYNNDLGGLQIAIDFLKSQPGKKKRIILSDILQSGLEDRQLYGQLNQIIKQNHINSLVGIGEGMMNNKSAFTMDSRFFETTDSFLQSLNFWNFHDEVILVKGARPFKFERITNLLSEKIHRTVLEINLDAVSDNLNFYRSRLNRDVKLMVMVKALAYGSGGIEIANLLQYNRVDYLAVAYPDEGVELRKSGIGLPIMVMNVTDESFANIRKYNLEPEIYSLSQLKKFIDFINGSEIETKIHIKIDSGMHRLGFEENHIFELIALLKSNPSISVASIYSHLAGADEEIHNDFSKGQVELFLKISVRLERDLNIRPIRHILNSAGIIRFPEYQLDMVRLGIGLYGFEANQIEQDELRPISTLKTVISQIKNVKKGDTIGYGRKGIAQNDATIATIATIAIGYADGFPRAFSNGKISLIVNGKMAPVIGNICMDMCMLDVTGIDAKEGDEVTVFGVKPSIKTLADAIDTIPYEILTNISSRVTRVFYTS